MENDRNSSKPNLKWLEKTGRLLDTQFRIPGTSFRFGIDPIVGLIPYFGDLITYAVSAILVFYMARHGASGKLVMKMIVNVTLDLVIGGFPIAGQIGDFMLRANERNISLFKEYLEEGKHSGSGIGILLAVFVVLLLIPILFAIVALKAIFFLKDWIFGGL